MTDASRSGWIIVAMLAAPLDAAYADEKRGDDVAGLDQAAEAYDQATAAHNAGDFARAAQLFARADELAPNPVALETALREALLADLPALGMTLAERSRREATLGPSLVALMVEAHEKLASRVGFVVVQCSGCTATLDGAPLDAERRGFVTAGARSFVEIRVGDGVERREVLAAPGETVTLVPTPAPPPVKPAPTGAPAGAAERPSPREVRDSGELDGIHPAWLTLGIGGTVALAVGSVASYVDTVAIEEALQAKRDAGSLAGAEELAERGRDAEIRTYVLEGLLAGSAVATLAVAVFAVDWDGPSPRARLTVTPGTATFVWRF